MDKPYSSLADSFLQWGSTKRMRCYKGQVRPDPNTDGEKKSTIRADRHLVRAEKKTTALPFEEQNHLQKQLIPKESILIPSEKRLCHNQVKIKSVFESSDLKLSIPYKDNTTNKNKTFGSAAEKSTRLHPLSNVVCTRSNNIDETNKISADGQAMQDKTTDLETFVWPKFHLTLSHNEKVKDFQAIKSAKLPLRPKKRSKLVQKTIHAITPGSWLSDLSQDRYQVREKKSMKKRSKGLKAMQSVDSDLE